MKKLFFLLIPVLMGLTACSNKLTVEQAEAAVMKGEKDRLPLLLQNMVVVEDITIDSIHLNITEEPMHGYLYTTWKAGKDCTPIIVEVDSIHSSQTRKGYVEWQIRWDNATKAYVLKLLGL